jgi:hypothetical protein
VVYINEILQESSAPFICELIEGKGRTLRVTRDAAPGDILFTGPPLHRVAEDLKNPVYIELVRLFNVSKEADCLDYEAMWFWCGLNSLSRPLCVHLEHLPADSAKQLKMLYHPEIRAPSATVRLVARAIAPFLSISLTDADLVEIETMTIIWTLNCFEYSDEPLTYATYFLPSFMSHSCGPTAMWTTNGEIFEIRAQSSISVGQELTVSYLTEEFCLRPKSIRQGHLSSTKFFTCDCHRCTPEVDDTRGYRLVASMGRPGFVRYPRWDQCACGCAQSVSLSEDDISSLIQLETQLVDLVNQYDSEYTKDDILPTRTNPEAIPSDLEASDLEDLITQIGIFHWASMRGLFQLAQYHKWLARYPKAIQLMELHIECKRKYVKFTDPEVSSSLAWALEELGDILLLHVSGSVRAGLSEASRELFCAKWNPKNEEDIQSIESLKILDVYAESTRILDRVFGPTHEHTVTAREKMQRVKKLLQKLE